MNRFASAILLGSLIAGAVSNFDAPAVAAQAKKEPKQPEEKEDTSRVMPAFDPGSHTQLITAMGFTKDKSKLITVGIDFTIQVWSTTTGERLDILRVPGYGRETGSEISLWDIAAVSADGSLVAIGGIPKWVGDNEPKARAMLVDVQQKKVRPLPLPTPLKVNALSFSPDGTRLAVSTGKDTVVFDDLKLAFQPVNGKPRVLPTVTLPTPAKTGVSSTNWAPNNRHLLVPDDGSDQVGVWDVPPQPDSKPELLRTVASEGRTRALAWAPDGKRFVRSWYYAVTGKVTNGIAVHSPDGTSKAWSGPELAKLCPKIQFVQSVAFTGPDSIVLVGREDTLWSLNLKTGRSEDHFHEAGQPHTGHTCAATPDGSLAAINVSIGREVMILCGLGTNTFVRCGDRSPIPQTVGWSRDPKAPGFAWSEEAKPRGGEPVLDKLQSGFDLTTIEPTPGVSPEKYAASIQKLGEYTLDRKAAGAFPASNTLRVKRGDTVLSEFDATTSVRTQTLIPSGTSAPTFAAVAVFAHFDQLSIRNADASLVARLMPRTIQSPVIAPSPDGRYLLTTTGTQRLLIYRTDGSTYETAGETPEHGFFTAALLKGLNAGEGVPFDPYERQMYVHHLYSVAFSEVRKATGGKQNPFLNIPWTMPPMPVREVSVGK